MVASALYCSLVCGACYFTVRLRPNLQDAVLPKHAHQGTPPLGHLNAPSNNETQLKMLMIISLVQFESKSSRAKGIAFHPKRSVNPAEGHLTPQHTQSDLKTGHGFSSPFTPLPSNCGTTAWELLSTDSKNTMARFAALISTQPNPCLCREVTITRSRFGTTRPGGACSH